MTDRELLELAAKAAGIAVVWGKWLNRHEWLVHYNTGDFAPWNPLTDDGDALRLAVRLNLWVHWGEGSSVNVCWYDEPGFFAGYAAEHGSDPYAATRRAIVRAAAEIGRAMP